eukprot:6455370-Amphidinium_carterae.1
MVSQTRLPGAGGPSKMNSKAARFEPNGNRELKGAHVFKISQVTPSLFSSMTSRDNLDPRPDQQRSCLSIALYGHGVVPPLSQILAGGGPGCMPSEM